MTNSNGMSPPRIRRHAVVVDSRQEPLQLPELHEGLNPLQLDNLKPGIWGGTRTTEDIDHRGGNIIGDGREVVAEKPHNVIMPAALIR
ncbi:hypothetical protein GCM10023176_07960 [Micromonospora coerulea]|uniref:Uncharacterized protein n=1 Tax=Micromonospora coerulea TaxID=47856 RepID=A0ABP8S897_9ACTN